ncbi:lysylphosphatidylglycerol synthase transmembrane domain-containing protein [Paenibacillus oryzisoli]|uniref:Phosphatidylglycerol lysyltransferase n=1 Tax=Paenibacillus oryzisoli TaxID=1850517 RepID=A0A198AHU4_9BACL|nr:lysylphosphatidylglycerol synthase transmembrane domain-containing protein [Paenibacillus oryzisoli]OAS20518.1 hypothetical protein A8708_18305 [Paenibacillus oryzisoli]
MKLANLISKAIIMFSVCMVLYLMFIFWGDYQSIKNIICQIHFHEYFLAILASLCGILIRIIKWDFMIKQLEIRIPKTESSHVFLFGLGFSITPGRIGELIKSYILFRKHNVDVRVSAPVIVVDHLTNFISLSLIVTSGIGYIALGAKSASIIIGVFLLSIFVLQKKTLIMPLIKKITSVGKLTKFQLTLSKLYRSSHSLLRVWPLIVTIVLTLIGCIFEAVPLWIFIKALDLSLSYRDILFVLSTGTIAGTLSMFPGGIGVADTSVIGLLMQLDIPKSMAVSISLLERLIVVWLGVLIGLITVISLKSRYLASNNNDNS